MEEFNIIALITFHEKIDCLNDQVENIFKFNKKTCVVINSGYDGDIQEFKEKWKESNVHIFERKIQHSYHDSLIPLHLECYSYMIENDLRSEYVIMLSSNQLFIRSNIFNLMKKYSASYFHRFITNHDTNWVEKSNNFRRFKRIFGEENFMFQSNHDGMFFKYDIFMNMMKLFLEHYDINDDTSKKCHLEEYLYSAYLLACHKVAELCSFSKYNFWPKDWNQPMGVLEFREAINKNLYIVKKIERKYNNPVRELIRNIQIFEENYEQG